MTEKGMSPEARAAFVARIKDLEPRLADVAMVGAIPPREWRGKYNDVAERYCTSIVEDTGITPTQGVLRGYRVYGAAIAQVPHALLEYDPDYQKDNMKLFEVLSRSLLPALGTVMGVNSDRNTELEKLLHLRSLPFDPENGIGFEFTHSRSGLIYTAKPELLIHKRGEISEEEIAASGFSYETLRQEEGCAMPHEFHQRLWGAMLRTCIFNYDYINADIDALKAKQVTSEVQ